MKLRTRQRDTLDPARPTTFRMVESQLEGVLLVIFILNMDRKPVLVELFISGSPMARMGFSDGKTKNGEISNNLDNA